MSDKYIVIHLDKEDNWVHFLIIDTLDKCREFIKHPQILEDYFGSAEYKASATDKAVLINGITIHTQEDGLIPQDVVQAVQGWVNSEIMRLSGLNGHLSVLSAQVNTLSCVCRINR